MVLMMSGLGDGERSRRYVEMIIIDGGRLRDEYVCVYDIVLHVFIITDVCCC